MPIADETLRILAEIVQQREQTVWGDPIRYEIGCQYDHEDAMFTATVEHVYEDGSSEEQFWYSAPSLMAALVGLAKEVSRENQGRTATH